MNPHLNPLEWLVAIPPACTTRAKPSGNALWRHPRAEGGRYCGKGGVLRDVTLLGTQKARQKVARGEERILVLFCSVCNNRNNIR